MKQSTIDVLNNLILNDFDNNELKLGDVVIDKNDELSQIYFDKDEGGFYAGTTPLSAFYIQEDKIRKYYEEA